MQIEVRDIPKEGKTYRLSFLWRDDKNRPRKYPVSGEIKTEVNLAPQKEILNIDGEVVADLDLECFRCLKKFKIKEEFTFQATYIPVIEAGKEGMEVELKIDELDLEFYEQSLEIEDVVQKEILLRLPIKPLCRPECKGLCPTCGVDLNREPCSGHSAGKDPRWNGLKKLLPEK